MRDGQEQNMHVVIGLGKTGYSCVRHLVKLGVPTTVVDNRAIPPCLHQLKSNYPDIPVYLDNYPDEILASAKALVVSPGVALAEPAIAKHIANGVQAIGDIELFARAAKAPIIAITGSNGKSTTTQLVGDIINASDKTALIGGNIGEAALDLLDKPVPDFYVLELSSFQLETTHSLRAKTAVVLNVSPDHLDRYDSYQHYIDTKKLIYKHCEHATVNRDDKASFKNVAFENTPISFGINMPEENQFGLMKESGETWLAFGTQKLVSTRALKIKGTHQYANALAAMALCHASGIAFEPMIEALKTFTGLRHRCQWVSEKNKVAFYNDSKATNVGATEAALTGLGNDIDGKIVLIAGGLGKGADFSCLKEPVAKHVRALVLIGRDAKLLANQISHSAEPHFEKSIEGAVKKAAQLAQPGDAVLLAPACASFDMFEHFEKRGDAFVQAVWSLSNES